MANAASAIGRNPGTRSVAVLALVAFIVKILLAATSIGTNDVATWHSFSSYILDHGLVDIYEAHGLFNHPPLVGVWLNVIGWLSIDHVPTFAFLVRLPAIIADFGSVFLVWGLTRRMYPEKRAFWSTAVFAFSPVLLLVSGFHGNTDPVFMFLLLAAVYVVGVNHQYAFGGALFGLSLSIKVVPVLMVPAFYFWLRSRVGIDRFFGAALVVGFAGYAYHLVAVHEAVISNVLGYEGLVGIWGIGQLVSSYGTIGRAVLVVAVAASVALVAIPPRKRARGIVSESESEALATLTTAFATTFLTFMVVTPGFGVQYLSWLVAPAVFLGLAFSIGYNTLAGWFLGALYLYWSGGWPLGYAESGRNGGQWPGLVRGVEQVLWLYLCAWLVVILIRAWLVRSRLREANEPIEHASPGNQ